MPWPTGERHQKAQLSDQDVELMRQLREDGMQAAERLDTQTVRIMQLETAIREFIEDNLHLADGDVCTLTKLKRAINYT